MANTKSRSELEPCEFHGIKDRVEMLIEKPVDALRLILKRECGLEWDGKQPLWTFLIDECRSDCMVERAHELFGKEFKEVDKAYRYLKTHEQLKNLDHEPGGEVLQDIERARQIVIGAIMVKPEDVDRMLPVIAESEAAA